eukprot:1881769-Alexandrium_andersonii.AAC.1
MAGGPKEDPAPPKEPPSPKARAKGNADSPFMPPMTVESPPGEAPPEMPPAPNSIEPLEPPPMAGGAEDDDPDA